MPCKVKVRIIAGRNLPIMDRSAETTDAFVELKLSTVTHKTDVYRKSLNPYWNSEWFRFDVDDEEFQTEPLQIRIMDYDTYSANDAIGKVYVDLNPLLVFYDSNPTQSGSSFSGWLPVFDTINGMRGEVSVSIKIQLYSELNRFRINQNPCEIQIFHDNGVPEGYYITRIQGFVEELVINDDPEYQWIDKIRTPRASNEARQTLFYKLSGVVKRRIGLKVAELGGNAVIGYIQCMDLEGESGVVMRGIGTAVTLLKDHDSSRCDSALGLHGHHGHSLPSEIATLATALWKGSVDDIQGVKSSSPPPPQTVLLQSGQVQHPLPPGSPRRSSDVEINTTTETGRGLGSAGSLSGGSGSGGKLKLVPPFQGSMGGIIDDLDFSMLEYPFLTVNSLPAGILSSIGGAISVHSVKLLARNLTPGEPEKRDQWWKELRMEVRGHARSMGCSVVIGYSESTSICDDICVLSAQGTGAVLITQTTNLTNLKTPLVKQAAEESIKIESESHKTSSQIPNLSAGSKKSKSLKCKTHPTLNQDKCCCCRPCHVIYSETAPPFPVTLFNCRLCQMAKVPDVLFATVGIPSGLAIEGKPCFIQARVCRAKRDYKGEQNAKEVSDSLPFLEYDLHKQLLLKLYVCGMNAIFNLSVQISIGEKMMIAVASATGVYLSAMALPPLLKISTGKNYEETAKVSDLCRALKETVVKCRENSGLSSKYTSVDSSDSVGDEANVQVDFATGKKNVCVLEIDDQHDVDSVALLLDQSRQCAGIRLTNRTTGFSDHVTRNLQLFLRLWRCRLPSSGVITTKQLSTHVERALQSLLFKLRCYIPCVVANVQCTVDLTESDELQISVVGTVLGIGESLSADNANQQLEQASQQEPEMMFNMDVEEQNQKVTDSSQKTPSPLPYPSSFHQPITERHGIEVTSLSRVPYAKVDSYLGNLTFFFIREGTSIREHIGGLNGFLQTFLVEVLAMVRAHVAALGGNALLSLRMSECALQSNFHKNQCQCLVNVSGDIVRLYRDLPHKMANISI